MNARSLAHAAYSQSNTPIRTDRGTEYEVLARVTHAMRLAAARGQKGFTNLADAIHKNRNLWTILAADVADKNNPLPKDLKARIFYLAEFTQSHSRKVLQDGASIAPLVEINAAVMRGLRQGEQKK
ncbi:MAG: flagellar biosynthesis regulator FlhF [Rhodobacterales bacterium]|nr:MAG: flagellar biosynthesis regulator FlhF [Rhodobacterales bacterium]